VPLAGEITDGVALQQAPNRGFLLLGLSSAGFLAATVGLGITPFLLAVANDLSTDLAAISVLFTFSNLAWALASLAAGPISDRLGRKPVLLAGMSFLAASCFGSALATDYPSLVFWRLLSGVGGGTQMPTVFAAAADLFPAARRGKALGWIMTGQSLALVAGVPLSALIGALAGWRWSMGVLGLVCCLLWLVVLILLPNPAHRPAAASRSEVGLGKVLGNPRVVALFAACTFERVCYSSVVVFFATYLLVTYELPLEWLAVALVVVALGNLAGNQIGGTLADLPGAQYRVVSTAMVANALLALPLLGGAPGLLISVGLGIAYNLTNGAVRPSLMWLVSELSRESRGAVMGLNVTVAGMGWLVASALGGWLVVSYGFIALGLLAGVSGLCSAALAMFASGAARTTGGQATPTAG
jgi:predicted MFS family arabinose efflux permease